MKQDLSTLRKGAIVSCFFPLTEAPDTPGPVARPALVVQVFRDQADALWKVVVAYGTSRRTRANMGYELRMNREDSLRRAGLHRPTRFTLSRMRILPFNRSFFSFSEEDTPVLGYLDETLVERLEKTSSLLAEIAAPLRPLSQRRSADILVREAWSHPRPPGPPPGASFDGCEMDRFMQAHLTGRANLNGARKRFG